LALRHRLSQHPPFMRQGVRRGPGAAAGLAAGLLAVLLAPGARAAGSSGASPRPNLILVTLDTTRADHLGAYGYPRPTSPALDRLAADSVVYTRAYSTSSWTLPAHASLFTGKFPKTHGARLDPEGSLTLGGAVTGPVSLAAFRARPLAAAESETLAGILRQAGYATAAIVAGPWMKRIFGLDPGFEHYDDSEIDRVEGRLARQVTDAAIAWLGRRGGKSFFLFLNYYDPHGPYTDPEGLAQQFMPPGQYVYPEPAEPSLEYLTAAYDGEIRYLDNHFGRLLEHLRATGLYDGAWIIVTADHGELLGEHELRGHGLSLYEGELQIPLLVKHPQGGAAPGRSDARIQLTDLVPVLLGHLGLPLPPGVQGRAQPAARPPLLAEVSPIGNATSAWRAYFAGPFKLLWSSRGHHQLYRIETDPKETRDLAQREPERTRALLAELDALYASLPEAAPVEPGAAVQLDEETRRTLEALGYLQ
jgi:arylsulfatase A-like enzyme